MTKHIRIEPLERFDFIDGLDLIPLHAYDAKSKGPKGDVRRDGKRPLDFGWQGKTYDAEAVVAACEKNNRNVGVRIGVSWLVVDIDPRNQGSLPALKAACPELDWSKCPRVKTGGGGLHLYVRVPANTPKLTETLKGLPGVEFKRIKRQVVAPGSIHPETGRYYFWDNDVPLCDAPNLSSAIIERLTIPARESVGGGHVSPEELKAALAHLDPLEFSEEGKWRELLFACHHATGGEGRAEFIEWSTQDPAYANDEWRIGARWDSLHGDKPGAITYKTLNKFLRDADAIDAQIPNDPSEDFDEIESAKPKKKSTGKLEYDIAGTVTPERIEWLWPNRFAKGKLSLVAGFPDQGKSQITLAIAAAITNGAPWPNAEGAAEQGAVIVLSAEDTAADIIVPRLLAAGADLNQVIIIKPMVKEMVDGKETLRVLNVADDLSQIGAIMKTERKNGRNVKAIILDPLNAYFGGPQKADTHKSGDMRALLTPISTWAGENDVAIIGIMHFNKGGNSHTLYRVTDSGAITAVARSVWFAVRDEKTQQMLFLRGKNNIGPNNTPGLAYSIEAVGVGPGNSIQAPRIVWDGVVNVTAEEALGTANKERRPAAMDDAEEWLSDYLKDGPKPTKQLYTEGRALGHSTATLRRAKDALGIVSTKEGYQGVWHWVLPAPGDDFEDEEEFG